jgi:hypothetical protein
MSGIPKHGVIKVSTMKVEHAKKHLASMAASASEVRDYGGHDGGAGFSSQGSMSPGGAGADYSTTNVGGTGDADSQGSTGY